MVKDKVFIVVVREGTSRGIGSSPEQRERVVSRIWPADWAWPGETGAEGRAGE